MASPTGCSRILQIHPTRRCNLKCLHCYSLSGPKEREEVAADVLANAITDASEAGYGVTSFSGGEPLLYKQLPSLLKHAHDCGMVTTVTTNGMLLDERKLAALQGAADLIAISLDGKPKSHNIMRASKQAFPGMLARLEGLRASAIPFGFIFTLTQYNLDELDWVAGFAVEQGAKLLQIHPLENVGRARAKLPGERPDEIESAHAVLESLRLKEELGDQIYVQVDLIHRELMEDDPARVFAEDLSAQTDDLPFSELVSPLVIEPDGVVVPIEYGFARRFALGNLHDQRLSELMAHWRREQLQDFRALCRRVYQVTTKPSDLPFFNWYETLCEMAVATP
ncbi:MAG TPA: radical SAM protein [Pyrinomonadaceae bacterium]|nr:radical SAM protein [Pyrinomonadaceae bacterium]